MQTLGSGSDRLSHPSVELALSTGRVGIVPAIMEGLPPVVRGVRCRAKMSMLTFLEDGAVSSGESALGPFSRRQRSQRA